MSRPFFSVIVPAHNSAEFIRRGLESIVNQDFDDYELTVVCDACTDDTAEVAAEYMGFGDSIIMTDYGRAGLARNEGLDTAIGDWILFMDDDDWFPEPTSLCPTSPPRNRWSSTTYTTARP